VTIRIIVGMREEAIRFLPAQDALATLRQQTNPVTATMLDPWYNRGVGGVIADSEYDEWLTLVLTEAGRISDHVFLWGFPEIVCRMLPRAPKELKFVAWLTWYFKNCPSVIRGWR